MMTWTLPPPSNLLLHYLLKTDYTAAQSSCSIPRGVSML